MLAISSMCGAYYTFFTKITSLRMKCFVEIIILGGTENKGRIQQESDRNRQTQQRQLIINRESSTNTYYRAYKLKCI